MFTKYYLFKNMENFRKLASIQRILEIEPIDGADKIEKATVVGWQVVVNKNEYKVGDLVIYCEVDSILPEKQEFEFLRERHFRIKTIKLRKQISQGICFPLSLLQNSDKYKEGDDVTEILGVVKYESASEKLESTKVVKKLNKFQKILMRYAWFRSIVSDKSKTEYPSFIKKTDELRIQNISNFYNKYKDIDISYSEKLDGQSATYFVVKSAKKWNSFWKSDYEFGICSRNYHLLKNDNSTWFRIADQVNIKAKLLKYAKENNLKYFVIQGEIVGEAIQGNKYNLKNIDFYMFKMFDNFKVYNNSEIDSYCSDNDFRHVPFLGYNFKALPTIQENVELSKGNSKLANRKREGIVGRNYEHNLSFKIINPDFLLENDL